MFYGQDCQIALGMYVSHKYPIFQGVRQGSVLSTSLFLIYVNDLFKEMETSNAGCYIGSLFVGSPSLADDISILAPTRTTCQKLLDIVCAYCSNWRLQLSASKSKLLVFGESKRERHCQHNLLLYNTPVPEAESITIVGMQITNTLSSFDRTLCASKKARRLINSLRSVGIGPHGLNPILSCEVWKRVCLPAAFHACELWSLTKTELVMLEKSQRYAAKIMQGFPIRTATDFALSTLGLISIEAYIDKCKLLFFGNLCNCNIFSTRKCIFLHRLFEFKLSSTEKPLGFIADTVKILSKYDLTCFLDEFCASGYFPPKSIWKTIVKDAIHENENNCWRQRLESRDDMLVYSRLHTKLAPFHLYTYLRTFPERRQIVYSIMKLLALPRNEVCFKCQDTVDDVLTHLLTSCRQTTMARDSFWNALFDKMSITVSATLYNLNDIDFIANILGDNIYTINYQESGEQATLLEIVLDFVQMCLEN